MVWTTAHTNKKWKIWNFAQFYSFSRFSLFPISGKAQHLPAPLWRWYWTITCSTLIIFFQFIESIACSLRQKVYSRYGEIFPLLETIISKRAKGKPKILHLNTYISPAKIAKLPKHPMVDYKSPTTSWRADISTKNFFQICQRLIGNVPYAFKNYCWFPRLKYQNIGSLPILMNEDDLVSLSFMLIHFCCYSFCLLQFYCFVVTIFFCCMLNKLHCKTGGILATNF